MKKRFLPLSMLLITIVLAQASFVANAAETLGKYTPRTGSGATISSFMKSIRANQETGLIDPALLIAGQREAQSSRDANLDWVSAGPDNFGGSTRAVIYDRDGNVLIGTAGGDIFRTTNNGITFQLIAHVNAPISCFVIKDNVLYIGTGDGNTAQRQNGLSDLGYDCSFVGSGVYKMEGNNTVLVSGTENIAFVNEMTVVGNDIYAATSEGLMKNWSVIQDGFFRSVKSNNSGVVLAADEADVYLVTNGNVRQLTGEGNLPGNNTNPKIIAMSPTNANFMYIAYISGEAGDYKTDNIYFTQDAAATWEIAFAKPTQQSSPSYLILGPDADISSFMVVYPNNPRKLLIGSTYLWSFEDSTSSGANSYRPVQISEYNCAEYTAIAWNRYYYLHQGIQNIVFNPNNSNEFFIGTEGGIYKGEFYADIYSYSGGNRYFLTAEEHVSTMRMMSVAVGGGDKVIGGSIDYGTMQILACDTIDDLTTGKAIFPNPTATNNAFGYFTKDYAGGPCFISTIDPNIIFVSGTGALEIPIHRSQTSGEDYDLTKFMAEGVITNENAFKTPYAIYENYNDDHHIVSVTDIYENYNNPLDTLNANLDTIYVHYDSIFFTHGDIYVCDTLYPNTSITINDTLYDLNDTILYIYNILHDYVVTTTIELDTLNLVVRRDAKAGDVLHYYSKQGGYPINYTMPEPPHDPEHVDPAGGYKWIQGDTIPGLHDPLKTNMIVGIEGKVYMTRDALIFDKDSDWFLISEISGIPSTVVMNANGTEAFVGTTDGNLYKITGIDDAFTEEQADVTDTLNPCVQIVQLDTDSVFAGRAITSIYVNPNNNNDILLTLGNYGNNNYVYRSTNGGASFTSIQGNLGRFPVYSGIIEKSTGLLIIGTEHGIYTSSDGAAWSKSGNYSSPVMGLTQAIMPNHDDIIDVLYDEMGTPTEVIYQGIHNEGMIYAATYGNGILMCGTYEEGSDFGVDEVESDSHNAQVSVYPNPVRGNAQFNFTMSENGNVSYQIFDLAGRMIVNSELGFYGEGEHTATINTESLTSGSYVIRVIAGNKMNTGKFLVY